MNFSRKAAVLVAAATLGTFALAGCGSSNNSAPAAPAAPAAAAPAAAPAKAKPVHLYLTIIDGKGDGKDEWPTFSPSNFSVPADTDVIVTIRNYDDGPADIPAEDAAVQGTVGNTMKVFSQTNGALDESTGKDVSSLDAKGVSHTFTFNGNGFNLNVPVPPSATVEFTFHTPKTPGKYDWKCLSACGTGKDGTEGTMATDGWMRGSMDVY